MGQRVLGFDTWQAGYGGASVAVYIAGTTTLAALFTDAALTVPAPNPVTLLLMSNGGVVYGKFGQPLYTASAYQLIINSVDQSGIITPPLTTVVGVDASLMTAVATGGSGARNLQDLFAAEVDARNYGPIGPLISSATNNATITSAISAAAALGGAKVLLPEGAIPFTALTLSAGVVLFGRGRGTTILQSQTAGKCITCAGDRAGLEKLDLDGVSLQANSIGFYAEAKNELVLRDVTLKRFATGMSLQGGRRMNWRDLFIDNCVSGAILGGDKNASGDNAGDELRDNNWIGGRVTSCSTVGVQLVSVDKKCYHNTLDDVGFENNPGVAFRITGARFTWTPRCWFAGNTTDFTIEDGANITNAAFNTVIGWKCGPGGEFSGGTGNFGGKCQDVIFEQCEFWNGAVFNFNLVSNNVLSRDGIEDSTFSLAGTDAVRWTRTKSIVDQFPNSSGITTDATATTAYKFSPGDGAIGMIEAKVVGVRRDGIDNAVFHIGQGFSRPGATLAYQTQTAAFTVGDILTGQTSGVQGRITANANTGATGTLTLKDLTGEFTNGELITSSSGGSATANGVLAHQNVALLGSPTSIEAAVKTDAGWAAVIAVSGFNVLVQVTGAGGKTVEWKVFAQVSST